MGFDFRVVKCSKTRGIHSFWWVVDSGFLHAVAAVVHVLASPVPAMVCAKTVGTVKNARSGTKRKSMDRAGPFMWAKAAKIVITPTNAQTDRMPIIHVGKHQNKHRLRP